VEGTSGAADVALFRESARKAALKGGSRFGEPHSAISFERGRNRTVVLLGRAFRQSWTRDGDRGCPSQSGWGKSTAVSGYRGGGRQDQEVRATPGLRKLGW
jgi:hypothetical protein